jgi:hypothetical protein
MLSLHFGVEGAGLRTFEHGATGWQLIHVQAANVDMHDGLADNRNRRVVFDRQLKRPIDKRYRSNVDRIPPRIHF